jgi:hypothetical protein
MDLVEIISSEIATVDNAALLTDVMRQFLHDLDDSACRIIRNRDDYIKIHSAVGLAGLHAAEALEPLCVGSRDAYALCRQMLVNAKNAIISEVEDLPFTFEDLTKEKREVSKLMEEMLAAQATETVAPKIKRVA